MDTSTTNPIIPQKSDLSSGSAKNSAKNDISVPDGTQLSLSTDTESRKQEQFTIIQETNPAPNSYNTWIRSVNDIKTLAETLQDSDYEGYDDFNPDLTRADIEKAIERGTITVYSSYPIKNGAFVTPSKMEAQSYSGNGRVYNFYRLSNDASPTMISTTLCAVMIYQTCGLDKKILQKMYPFLQYFLAEKERFELSRRDNRPTPLAGAPLRPLEYFSVYSSQVAVCSDLRHRLLYTIFILLSTLFLSFFNLFL